MSYNAAPRDTCVGSVAHLRARSRRRRRERRSCHHQWGIPAHRRAAISVCGGGQSHPALRGSHRRLLLVCRSERWGGIKGKRRALERPTAQHRALPLAVVKVRAQRRVVVRVALGDVPAVSNSRWTKAHEPSRVGWIRNLVAHQGVPGEGLLTTQDNASAGPTERCLARSPTLIALRYTNDVVPGLAAAVSCTCVTRRSSQSIGFAAAHSALSFDQSNWHTNDGENTRVRQ